MRTIFLFLLCLAAPRARAQVFMRAFEGAPALALGGATLALPNTQNGIANDAQLGLGDKLGFWAGYALPYCIGGWQSLQFQGLVGIDRHSAAAVELAHAGAESYKEQRFRLQYGRKLGEKFLLGGHADVLHISQQEYGSVSRATFGLSIFARALPKLWIGARVQNPFQQKLGTDFLPSLLQIGACWKPSELLLLSAETEKEIERPAQLKAGMEYRPVSMLVLRAGMRTGPSRVGFGAGFRLKNGLRLDVGSEWHPALGITPAAMISWQKT